MILDGGVGKDGIPALSDPVMTEVGTPEAGYVSADHRIIGIVLDGQPIAIPHALGWVHEIVNLSMGDRKVAVTYCPLTGSSLVFDRSAVGGAEFGVSGLLYMTNLIMYDRRTQESLWPQMSRGARCGPANGTPLELVPAIEMTWDGWRTLHPDSWVPANDASIGQRFSNYRYPYGGYEELNNSALLFPVPSMDPRRPPKERVLGLAQGSSAVAFPFGALDAMGPRSVAEVEWQGGAPVAVFWDRLGQGAAAYYARVDGSQPLSFRIEDGAFVDSETGSEWNLAGRALSGPLEGHQLETVAEAYVAFWFAWASFHPHTAIWGGSSQPHHVRPAHAGVTLAANEPGGSLRPGQWHTARDGAGDRDGVCPFFCVNGQ